MFKKIYAFLLVIAIGLSIAACSSQKNNLTIPDTYSVGLDDEGYYLNFDSYNFAIPDFSDVQVSQRDVLKNYIEEYQLGTEMTVDDYVYSYLESLINSLGLNNKDVAEITDIVEVSLNFIDKDGNDMPNYQKDSMTIAISPESDDIGLSLIGHKVSDEYDIEYTFDENEDEYANQTVSVHVKVLSIGYEHPLEHNIVEENIDTLSSLVPTAIDLESLKKDIIPYLAFINMESYVENSLLNFNMDVPEELVNYEYQRLLFRLNTLEYDYETYLAMSGLTHETVMDTCRHVALENIITMSLFKDSNWEITDEDIETFYGNEESNGYNNFLDVYGMPYMRLRLIRNAAINKIASQITILDDDGNAVDISTLFPTKSEDSDVEASLEDIDSEVSETSDMTNDVVETIEDLADTTENN